MIEMIESLINKGGKHIPKEVKAKISAAGTVGNLGIGIGVASAYQQRTMAANQIRRPSATGSLSQGCIVTQMVM